MKSLILSILILLTSSLFGQIEWESRKAIPQYGRHAGASFEINGKLYLGCGRKSDGSYANDFWEYDPANDNWTQKANYPAGARFIPTGFSINGKGYFCLGLSSSNSPSKALYEYNPTNNTWTQKANFPGSARYGAAAFVIGDTAYVGTGSNGSSSYLSDFYMYVPSTNAWTSRAAFPGTNGGANIVAFSIGNFGYFGNKTTSSTRVPSNKFWEYSPSSNSWSATTDMPGTARRITAAFVLDNEAYVGCGTTSGSPVSNFINDFYKYNATTNSWTHLTSNSNYSSKIDPELFVVGDTIAYSVAGYSENGSLAEVWAWNPNQDTCDYFDTTFVQDTTVVYEFIYVQDTTFVNDTAFTFDTTFVTVNDTNNITIYDTITTTYYDTTLVNVIDTITQTIFDTITIYKYDTVTRIINIVV
jgi:N-acetylneuraminic acid mutarotase